MAHSLLQKGREVPPGPEDGKSEFQGHVESGTLGSQHVSPSITLTLIYGTAFPSPLATHKAQQALPWTLRAMELQGQDALAWHRLRASNPPTQHPLGASFVPSFPMANNLGTDMIEMAPSHRAPGNQNFPS